MKKQREELNENISHLQLIYTVWQVRTNQFMAEEVESGGYARWNGEGDFALVRNHLVDSPCLVTRV